MAEAGAHLVEELGRLDPERPLFLFVHLYDVHNRTLNEGREVIYPAPAPYQDMFLDERCEPLPELSAAEIWDHPERLTAGQLRTLVAYYDGGIRHVDAELEGWFGLLEREGWLAGALVIPPVLNLLAQSNGFAGAPGAFQITFRNLGTPPTLNVASCARSRMDCTPNTTSTGASVRTSSMPLDTAKSCAASRPTSSLE